MVSPLSVIVEILSCITYLFAYYVYSLLPQLIIYSRILFLILVKFMLIYYKQCLLVIVILMNNFKLAFFLWIFLSFFIDFHVLYNKEQLYFQYSLFLNSLIYYHSYIYIQVIKHSYLFIFYFLVCSLHLFCH
jgi:hypothetical protein